MWPGRWGFHGLLTKSLLRASTRHTPSLGAFARREQGPRRRRPDWPSQPSRAARASTSTDWILIPRTLGYVSTRSYCVVVSVRPTETEPGQTAASAETSLASEAAVSSPRCVERLSPSWTACAGWLSGHLALLVLWAFSSVTARRRGCRLSSGRPYNGAEDGTLAAAAGDGRRRGSRPTGAAVRRTALMASLSHSSPLLHEMQRRLRDHVEQAARCCTAQTRLRLVMTKGFFMSQIGANGWSALSPRGLKAPA